MILRFYCQYNYVLSSSRLFSQVFSFEVIESWISFDLAFCNCLCGISEYLLTDQCSQFYVDLSK